MKKILALVTMALMLGAEANAQLSQAETTARTIRVGNRPQEGSYGIYIGATGEMFNDMFDSETEFKSLPLVNLKYMVTDNVEARLGLQFYKKGASAKTENDNYTYKFKDMTTENRIYPGLAYHFSPRNILDVYMGAELLLGWNREAHQTVDEDNVSVNGVGSLCGFQLGGGLFIGLQAFLCDLPVALGLEYGFHGYGCYGQKYKRETEDGDRYTIDTNSVPNFGELSGDKVSASKSQFGQQVRITLSYYFN